ncbi:MAG TPA: methyltransferase domain-containing protein [Pseudomonas xinjiangensis]|uniref:Ribosomal RNA small subunit methyltransferase C n=2 Tax=root TaxID=1 RepID=A0A7V1FRT0_9GAMM|nr:methyltransferase domain-containing protein [Halopseudomonas xinjiangensis]HEC47642.1 methyltransferase domain-containing protein [Halopseudomonas xinjiangensis]
MDNTSQILARSAELFAGKRVLLVNPVADGLTAELPADWHVWTWDYSVWLGLNGRLDTARLTFSHLCPDVADIDAVVLIMPKALERAEYALAQMAPLLAAGCPLYLTGEKKGGVSRAEKLLQPYGDQCEKLDSARHCQLWRAVRNATPAPFALGDWQRSVTLELVDQTIELVSLPGVFSHGRLDEGSELLLDEPGKLPAGRVLDFGCGAGVLATALARRNPAARFELVDVDALALYCARQTLLRNAVEAEVYPSDGLSDVHGRFAAVVSNPPFHTGIRHDTSIAERFFERVTRNLVPGGELRIVANGFLKYPGLIEAHIGPCNVLRENTRFKVYSAVAPG